MSSEVMAVIPENSTYEPDEEEKAADLMEGKQEGDMEHVPTDQLNPTDKVADNGDKYESDAEEGEILSDDEEEQTQADKSNTSSTETSSPIKDKSSKKDDKRDRRRDDDKRKSSPRKSSPKRSSDSRKGKKRGRDSDEDSDEENKKSRRRRKDSTSDSDSNDDDDKQKLMVTVMQQMAQMLSKKGKQDKKTLEVMEKLLKNQNEVDSKEVREIVKKNKRLLRDSSREKDTNRGKSRSPSKSRDKGSSRSSRREDRDRRRRSRSRDKDKESNKNNSGDSDMRPVIGLLGPLIKEKCKFFAEGKCLKGHDCPYSHEIPVPKKREICKFYLQGYCGKGDHCLFQHEAFPCKFFHTGAECYSGDNCRFSHQPLTEEGRTMLRGYLDSGELPDDHLRRNEEEKSSQDMNNAALMTSTSTASSSTATSSSYQPLKPVPKRYAVLGDITEAMKTSYYTWIWQQEMKELEVAYVGTKRNLFTIEKPFVMTEKPLTPPPDDQEDEDPDERECKIMSYYIDTMGTLPPSVSLGDTDCRVNQMPPPTEPPALPLDTSLGKEEEQDDYFFSAHDEDLRLPPPSHITQTTLPAAFQDNNMSTGDTSDVDRQSWMTENVVKKEEPFGSFMGQTNDPATGDAAFFGSPSQMDMKPPKPKYDIAKMLNVIRQSSGQPQSTTITTSEPTQQKHSEFWQNILSGASFTSTTKSPSPSSSPSQAKDPRLKKDPRLEKDSSLQDNIKSGIDLSSTLTASKDTSVDGCEWKVFPVTVPGIDYSSYYISYSHDSRLKNDPRLQKFFTKNTMSSNPISHLLSPSQSSTSPTINKSTLDSLMSMASSSSQDKKETPSSPTHFSLPPLTLSLPKPLTTTVPPPPPVMSPRELMSSSRLSSSLSPVIAIQEPKEERSDDAVDLTFNKKILAGDTSFGEKEIESIGREDTPTSPSSRRSSLDVISSPPVIQSAVEEESPVERTDQTIQEEEPEDCSSQSMKQVFGSIDPTASPFGSIDTTPTNNND